MLEIGLVSYMKALGFDGAESNNSSIDIYHPKRKERLRTRSALLTLLISKPHFLPTP